MTDQTPSAGSYYDAVAETYGEQYDPKGLSDIKRTYPANYFRMQLLIDSFVKKKIGTVIEVGVGEGTPLVALAKAELDASGFDLAPQMVQKAKENFAKNGLDPDHIFEADIRDPRSYQRVIGKRTFDGLLAMGVMPHVEDDRATLINMASMVRSGGSVFIEFRNVLFSLVTFNRYTADFILNDLLSDVDPKLKAIAQEELEKRVRMDTPPLRTTIAGSDAPGYDAILSKFHNPFEVAALFKELGFTDVEYRWYHYHPAMPFIADRDPELYRKEALRLEGERSGWKGMFLCSAFVIEAVKA